ncbi:MAG: hypothetical protein BGO43_07120 [Gammaproteobacteria bacterium 39-13]|nr:hypothetical protein [Gammaproteobacteria bacterium]OJV88359.1 MAG: hypothetical protein BGO43_07120 [Gammaproteobacteria bacterium 39-13]
MKLEAFQFCYAVIKGDQPLAQKLLSTIELDQLDEWGISAASFCLWAAKTSPVQALQQLQTLYPNYAAPQLENVSSVSIQDICVNDILPRLKKSFDFYMQNISKHAAKIEIVSNDKYAFFYECTKQALASLLNTQLQVTQKRLITATLTKLQNALPLSVSIKKIPGDQNLAIHLNLLNQGKQLSPIVEVNEDEADEMPFGEDCSVYTPTYATSKETLRNHKMVSPSSSQSNDKTTDTTKMRAKKTIWS